MSDEAPSLACAQCGAALTNEALVDGACSYCEAALQLPNDPGKRAQGRFISKDGDPAVLRIDDEAGVRVERMEHIVFDRREDATDSTADAAPRGPKPTQGTGGAKRGILLGVAVILLFVAYATWDVIRRM